MWSRWEGRISNCPDIGKRIAAFLAADSWNVPMPEPLAYVQDHAVSVSEESFAYRPWLLQGLVLLVSVGLIYHSIMARLVANWWNDPDFSHGFIIPLFSLFVVWQQRKKLAKLPLAPNWFGLVVIAGALVVLIVGVLGAELF